MMKDRQSTLAIDVATEQDLDAIMRIEQESFSAPWTRKMFEVELDENPFGRLVVARMSEQGEQDAIIGYVCFWIVFEELRLMNLAVISSARRQGIGGELLRYALAQGLGQGAGRALLEVRASNLAALALYDAAGFCRTSIREKYYTKPVEDAVLMEMDPLRAWPHGSVSKSHRKS
jgi:ribosomal-protein-alanine N-acetyltransferase